MKGLGAGMILLGGFALRSILLRRWHAERRMLRGMIDLLHDLEREIGASLLPLPRLLEAQQTDAEAFCTSVHRRLAEGKPFAESWQDAAEELALAPRERSCIARLSSRLSGEEESVRRALSAAAEELSEQLAGRDAAQSGREKLLTALCVSGSVMLFVVLL